MPKKWLEVFNKADTTPEIVISGQIGKSWWDDSGTSEKEFREALKTIPRGTKFNIRINSEGGSVQDGLGIYNALKQRRDDVTAHVDGYAVSIASVIPLAAGKVVSPRSSIWMIHEPWSYTKGDAEEHRKSAEALDKHGDMLASIYAEETGKDKDEMRDLMRAETWFTGEEATEFGLADETTDDELEAYAALDPQKFQNIPDKITKILAAGLPGKNNATRTQPASEPAAPLSTGTDADGELNKPANSGAKEDTMKEKIVALLKKHGQTVADDATEEQLQAQLDKCIAGQKDTINADLQKLQTELLNERRARITDKVDALIDARKITKAERDEEIELCLARPARLAVLDKREPQGGSTPVGQPPRIEDMKTVRDEINAHKPGKDRFQFLKNEWSHLKLAGVPVTPVYNSNTTDSTALTTDMLASGLIVVLQNRLPALAGFTNDFGTDRIKPAAKVQVPIVTAGGTAQTSATDFEDTTNFVGTIDNVEIAPARITSGSHITAAELNNGFRMAQWTEIKAHELADAIQALVNALLTTTNYTLTPIVSAYAAFGQSEMNDAWASISKSAIKNIMLHQNYYKKLLPGTLENFNVLANNIPGWDLVALNTNWTGAGTNVSGFACNPQAIACAAGLPLASPNRAAAGTQASTVTVPGLNLSVELQQWFSNKTKTDWANWEVMFGCSKADETAGVLIKTA